MANAKDSLASAMTIDGAVGVILADYSTGVVLGQAGGSGLNLDIAAVGTTEFLNAKMKVMAALGLKDTIEDMLITLGTQFHIIRPLVSKPGLFLYIAFDKTRANLAMARYKLTEIEAGLTL